MIIKMGLSIGFVKAIQEDEIEIDDSELEGMTEEEKKDYINETVEEWANGYIDIWWKEVKE